MYFVASKEQPKCISNEPKPELVPDLGECRDTV